MGLAWSWGCKRELGSPCELGGSSQLTFRLVKYSILDTVYTQEFLGVGVLRKRVFTLLRVGCCQGFVVIKMCSGFVQRAVVQGERWLPSKGEGGGGRRSLRDMVRTVPEISLKTQAREGRGWKQLDG